MTVPRSLRSWLTATSVVVLGLAFTVLVAPAASADLSEQPVISSGNPGATPMMLASTGLDITVPVVIGLATLVVGTIMVGWAFLATGRGSQHR